MPIHARQLPKNSNSVLHAVVEPDARVDGTSLGGAPSSVGDRREIDSSDDLRLLDSSERGVERDAAVVTNGPWYRREPWLVVQLLAFVPIIAAMFLPKAYHLPLFGVGGSLIIVGIVLLIRRELTASHPSSAGDPRAA